LVATIGRAWLSLSYFIDVSLVIFENPFVRYPDQINKEI
jgi:hypothetical protein